MASSKEDIRRWRTPVSITALPEPISYSDQIMLIGSCFSEHIGNLLEHHKFNVFSQPYGIQYNPASIADGLKLILDDNPIDDDELFFSDGLWHSFRHHGRFSHPDKDQAIRRIEQTHSLSRDFLFQADWLILSFGTAWYYRHRESGLIVTNNHKQPAHLFSRARLKAKEIKKEFAGIINAVRRVNPRIKIMLSVSPVRHIKDGLVEDRLSKSTLILAAHELAARVDDCFYFPSYEIVQDELRDYRFYKDDMLHPSTSAINYIWERFGENCLEEESRNVLKEVNRILISLAHRPIHRASSAHLSFLQNLLDHMEKFSIEHPYIDLRSETDKLNSDIQTAQAKSHDNKS